MDRANKVRLPGSNVPNWNGPVEPFTRGELLLMPSGERARFIRYHPFEEGFLECQYVDEPRESYQLVNIYWKLVRRIHGQA